MSKSRTNSASSDPAVGQQPEGLAGRSSEIPLPDAFTQIRDARNRLIAAIIDRAEKDGCYQRTKWLFEYGGILPAGQTPPEDESSLMAFAFGGVADSGNAGRNRSRIIRPRSCRRMKLYRCKDFGERLGEWT